MITKPASPTIALALLAVVVSVPLFGQEQPGEPSPVTPDAAVPAAVSSSTAPEPFEPTLGLSGWAQLDYRRAGDGGDPELAPTHELVPRRIRVQLAGKVTPRISFSLVGQGDRAPSDGVGVLDASVTFALTPWLGLQAGQFKYDFDVSGPTSTAATLLVDRPFVTQAVAGGLDGSSAASRASGSFRDRGLMLTGERAAGSLRIVYSAGLFQGNGRRSDNNDDVSFVSRAQLWRRRQIGVSAGFLDGRSAASGSPLRDSYRAWTAGLFYETPRLLGRFEYYGARRGNEGRREDVEGFYVTGVVAPHPDLDLMVRYQTYRDPAALDSGGRARSVDLGVEWYFVRKARNRGTSLAANLLLRDADDVPIRGFTLLNDGQGDPLTRGSQLGTAFVVRFQFEY